MALTDDLISAWEMGEASGNRADSHGTNTLTDENTVLSGTGLVYALAADFEKDNSERLTLADNASISTGNIDFTFELWFKAETLANFDYFFSKRNNLNNDYELSHVTGNVVWETAAGVSLVGGTITTGAWTQLFVWHDAAADLIGFKINDGTASTLTTSGVAPQDTDGLFAIGARGHTGAGGFFDGLIGPVRFWKRMLTAGEYTELYNAGAGRDYAYLTAGSGGGGGARRRRLLLGLGG